MGHMGHFVVRRRSSAGYQDEYYEQLYEGHTPEEAAALVWKGAAAEQGGGSPCIPAWSWRTSSGSWAR